MGWRKLTIPDGDMARCRSLSDRAGTQYSDLEDLPLAIRQHLRKAGLVQLRLARAREVTAVC